MQIDGVMEAVRDFVFGGFKITAYGDCSHEIKRPLLLGRKVMTNLSSVAQSCPTLCDPMNRSTPGLPVHHQLPDFTQTNSGPSNRWCHPAISSSVVPFSSCPQSLQHQSFPMSQLFAWGVQSTGVSALASFLPKTTHDIIVVPKFGQLWRKLL